MNKSHLVEFLNLVNHLYANLASTEKSESFRGKVEDAPESFLDFLSHDIHFVWHMNDFMHLDEMFAIGFLHFLKDWQLFVLGINH